jgi:hypothetical protein
MAAHADDDVMTKLRALRDRLAVEEPRARARPNVTVDLKRRLQETLELLGRAYLLDEKSTSAAILEEVREDAVVEAHLVLHDWERWLALEEQRAQRAQQARARVPTPTPAPIDRRVHYRHDTNVAVKLLRYDVRENGAGGLTLDTETSSRPARNVSAGGIFVAAARGDLPQLTVGRIVHVSVSSSLAASLGFRARAAVQRRDDQGLGLSWIVDSDAVRAAIDALLEAVRRARTSAG